MGSKKLFVAIRYFVLLIIIGALVLVVLYVNTKERPIEYTTPLSAVSIALPQRGNISSFLTFNGYISSQSTIAVVPFVGGTIISYETEVGEFLHEGDVIARIDDKPYRQHMLQAQAASLVAQTTFDRIQRLYRTNSVTTQVFEEAKAQKEATDAQLELARIQLGYTTITAPISATVVATPATRGDIASQTQPVAMLADLDDLIVRISVPERYFDLLRDRKDSLEVLIKRETTSSITMVESATIKTISPFIDPRTKSFEIVCALTSHTNRFSPGMYCSVILTYETLYDVPLLTKSIQTIDGSWYIYDPESRTAQWIQFSPVAENDFYIAVPEEFAQYWFIVDGQHFVLDGQPVLATPLSEESVR